MTVRLIRCPDPYLDARYKVRCDVCGHDVTTPARHDLAQDAATAHQATHQGDTA